MITVTRLPEPRALRRNGNRWLQKLNETLANPGSTEREKENAINKYRHNEIKLTLKQMFQNKCAYCESKIAHIDYGDIEHFKPKSSFPKLTFIWTNLLFSCKICNDSGHKGDKFPLDPQGKPVLIDPSDPLENINQHLDFLWDEITEIGLVTGKDARGQQVIDIFDLNGLRGRKELIEYRTRQVKRALVLAIYARDGDQTARDLLLADCQPDAEYSAFTRAICQRFGIPI